MSDDLYVLGGEEAVRSLKKDMAWLLCRLDLSNNNVDIKPENQNVPSWSATNSVTTTKPLKVKKLAFQPMLLIQSLGIVLYTHLLLISR